MLVNTLTDSRCWLVKLAEETRRMKASGENPAAKRKVAREVRVLDMPGITAATAYKAVHRQGTVTVRH